MMKMGVMVAMLMVMTDDLVGQRGKYGCVG